MSDQKNSSSSKNLNNFNVSKKVMPTAPEAERSVIGCLLLDKDAIIKIADLINADDFYHDHHRFVFEAVLELFHHSEPIDLVTVATKLQSHEKLELIGGPEFLAELQNEVPLATHIFQYAQLVKHRATLRKLISAGQEVMALGYDAEKSVEELLEAAEKRIFSISQNFIRNRFIPIKEILTASYERLCEISENPELAEKTRIKTGFRDLDNKFNGGFNQSDLIIIAARPSMGKTALSLAIAQNAAIQKRKHVGIISLEMSKEQIVERMFCSQLEIDSWKLHKGKLEDSDFEKMGPVMDQLSSAPIFIDDSMGGSLVELRAKARRLQMEHGLDMLVIDYLQLMSGNNPMNRVQEISEISRNLKELARELHIPVVALSQLSRGVESRPDKRPLMSDLRDSGSIEQDADIVMMLYRDDYYNEESELQNQLELNIVKHRNGAIGRVILEFDRSKMRFADFNREQQAGF
ncbi:replicative DNA helicase [bacterium]|mgnify:CR=1 FL=1|jgi:replicative DNA helicase|nr:replicative DNA helicase [bacterium]MBT6831607.1 replicative DNA helicase [bacterium]MBT6996252.1 replicative DNA helicase [bacterium]MBT7772930.1 replicative DNA helicase [bacterium]